jgi:hypothetical protein
MDSSQSDIGTTAFRRKQRQTKAMVSPESSVEGNSFVFSTPLLAEPTDNDILMHSFNDYSMDFSIIDYAGSMAFSARVSANSRSRTRRSNAGTTRRTTTAHSDRSTSDSQPGAARRSRRIRRPRDYNSASDPTLTTAGNDSSNEFNDTPGDTHSGLGNFLQLSVLYTAGLADEVSSVSYNRSSYHASVREQAAETVTVQASSDNRKHRPTNSLRPHNSGSGKPLQPNQNTSSSCSILATLAEKARASIECPLCLSHYDEKADRLPCTMLCGHSMCLSHAKDVGGCCPICRSSFRSRSLKKSVVLCDAAEAINNMVAALALT